MTSNYLYKKIWFFYFLIEWISQIKNRLSHASILKDAWGKINVYEVYQSWIRSSSMHITYIQMGGTSMLQSNVRCQVEFNNISSQLLEIQ